MLLIFGELLLSTSGHFLLFIKTDGVDKLCYFCKKNINNVFVLRFHSPSKTELNVKRKQLNLIRVGIRLTAN